MTTGDRFHKWFVTELERAPERPADLPDLGCRDWGLDHQQAVARFSRNTEWPGRFGPSALEDR